MAQRYQPQLDGLRGIATSENPVWRARTAPRYPHPGDSTAIGSNVAYRLGKLRDLGLLQGVWLDCGCAEGGYTEALVAWGAQKAIGVDPERSRIDEAMARKLVNDEKLNRRPDAIEYHCCTDDFPLPDASVDATLLNEVLEHVADEAATLREIWRVLRPGGLLVVMSPNRWFPFEGHGMQVLGRSFGFPIPLLPWLPSSWSARVMTARNYWPHELRNVVAAAGFEIRKVDYVLPVLERYQWLPASAIPAYRRLMPWIEKTPLRKFGVSTLVVATRPVGHT
ncbi:MAG: class I SAM-dependent methyltransferase [Mesorhizobium sp.]|uniref:class I SAM-dependent methyltransferase n=1 Tax=Mesorhizobium sp. TaxID=1871066 RepID=UPI000FE53328|nr:class I SAM-dependent methyltransferase [Mesorhizobium sp.]RWE84618.1 MAG: class I SAM-dependent methyltransferase [Mesorhizobium sp.]TJW65252.1 MAG: class I SAM-dependent methyltransferase [Mesorhizobium sp.]